MTRSLSRLQAQLHRLFRLPEGTDPPGMVKAMVLELGRPADWTALSMVWRGVQGDLALPAPAIAVNGVDGYQLWFSLRQPLPTSDAQAFLQGLCARYLPGIAPHRIALLPGLAPLVPAQQEPGDQWSAFVAPDLAPVFSETPWLDIPPSEDGQAELLSRLADIPPDDFQTALSQLRAGAAVQAPQAADAAPPANTAATPRVIAHSSDPRRFLEDVMNNDAVPLALRIEAAKALLPDMAGPARPTGNH